MLKKLMIWAGITLVLLSAPLQAADIWPSKPIRFVVGFKVGGPSVVIARGIAQKMSQGLGKAIVIDNKPGTGGNLATESVCA